jgi:tetratricopeptide (TPR) repeat protein
MKSTQAGPTWRSPWAWASLLAVLPLVLHSLGAPLGEPFADDFDYIRRMLLEGGSSFFDGCGSVLYWRPLGRQVYFGLLSPLIVAHPVWVPIIHFAALATMALLLYRAFRTGWPGPWAAGAATFILFAESTRMLAAWPSHFMDLGALLSIALAIHEAAQRRLWSAALAIVASLMFKEVGVLAAVLVAWIPTGGPWPATRRRAWTIALAAAVAVWGIVYLVVTRTAGLTLPHEYGSGVHPETLPTRLVWAIWNSLRAQFSLEADRGPWDLWIGAGLLAVLAGTAWRFAAAPEARERLRAARGWIAWGLVWFLAGVVPLAEVWPAWAPYRSDFGGIGLGVALVGVCAAAGPWLLGALVALRIVAFALSPGPPAAIAVLPTDSGAAFDFPRLVRLERFVSEARTTLQKAHPTLPHGSLVAQHYLPLMTEYALAGDKALQVWYRDTTLRWVRFERFQREPDLPLSAIVEYQPHMSRQFALVDPEAMRIMLRGTDAIRAADWQTAIDRFDRADSLQTDRGAGVFLGSLGGKRAIARLALGEKAEAYRAAQSAYAYWPDNADSRFVLADLLHGQGRDRQAVALLDTLLAKDPADNDARRLRKMILDGAAGQPR